MPRLVLGGLLASLAPTVTLAQSTQAQTTQAQTPPAQVYVARAGNVASIVVSGRIAPETESAFRSAVSANRGARVVLSSDGGSLVPALSIGRLIRENRLQTYVPDRARCFSACSLIWLAGTERHIGQRAAIGFHAAYVAQQGGPGMVSSAGNAVIGAYLSRLGYNDGAIRLFTSAPPNQMVVVKPNQFEQNGVSVRQTAMALPSSPGTAPASTAAVGAPGGFGGIWVGQIQCGKGFPSVNARMSVRDEGNRFLVKFDVTPSPGAPANPRSRYRLRGERQQNGSIRLASDGATATPQRGQPVSMTGTVSGDTFAARVSGPEECAPLTMRRR
ncbi:COG3904 family protein [Roseococcus pinisoli]|uniref:Uncharacterized protein n=1 Tax=Roseococcus pinisoli TaxID=2835040 RepID=A0ABS5QD56_9PROT|nr:hypothetical protein [Roseococcus pinisoli]MBS7811328.1 hypothetical protein [Roseococcus pinisoli]